MSILILHFKIFYTFQLKVVKIKLIKRLSIMAVIKLSAHLKLLFRILIGNFTKILFIMVNTVDVYFLLYFTAQNLVHHIFQNH